MNSLGEKIAHYRRKAGLTQEQLAEKCSVTAQAVSKWENGITSPDISLIAPLAELFGISCDELMGANKAETGECVCKFCRQVGNQRNGQGFKKSQEVSQKNRARVRRLRRRHAGENHGIKKRRAATAARRYA